MNFSVRVSHAKQVLYVQVNDVDHTWCVVVHGKRQIIGIKDVVDEEKYDKFDEAPLLSSRV